MISRGWHEVGSFLGPSIRDLHARLPIAEQIELWRAAGIEDVRVRRLSLGGGVRHLGAPFVSASRPGVLCAGAGRLA